MWRHALINMPHPLLKQGLVILDTPGLNAVGAEPELTVNLTLRQNASIFATETEAKRLEAVLSADPDVDHYSTYVGRGAIRFILTFDVQLANPFFAQFVIVASFDGRSRDAVTFTNSAGLSAVTTTNRVWSPSG